MKWLIKTKFCVCLCVLDYSSRNVEHICTESDTLIPWDHSEKFSSVREPLRAGSSIALKPNTIEELLQHQNSFDKETAEAKTKITGSLSYVRVPMRMTSADVITVDNTVRTNVLRFRDCTFTVTFRDRCEINFGARQIVKKMFNIPRTSPQSHCGHSASWNKSNSLTSPPNDKTTMSYVSSTRYRQIFKENISLEAPLSIWGRKSDFRTCWQGRR
jgi:hypothetical protein